MAGPLKRVQMRDGSVLKLNAEDEARAREQGLVGKPAVRDTRPVGPDDPDVFYDAGDQGDAADDAEADAETESKAVEAAPANKAVTSARAKGKG